MNSKEAGMSDTIADELLDAWYAEWLMQQPDAAITSGDVLIERMESMWGWERFVASI